MISPMISYMILQKSYVFCHDIRYLWYYSWYHGTFHMKSPMISVTYDIDAVWYHTFRDIIVYIMATGLDILAYIMVPGRRDGTGWGRHAPAAPPPPASPSPTYWGRVLSWTATDLIQLLSNCLLYTLAYSHSHSTALSLSLSRQADSDSVSLSPSRWLEAGLLWPPSSSWRPLCTSRGVTQVHERR